MANICSTAYTIEGKAKEVKALYELMKELEEKEKPAIENGYGITWLGCLVNALGGDWHDVYCRGEWYELQFDGRILTFCTETAWSACNEVFDLVCEKFPSLSYYYQAEEPGMGDYYTNDIDGKYYPDRYVVNLITDEGEWCDEYFEDLPSLYEWLEEIADVPINSEQDVQALKKRWKEINPNAFISISEFKVLRPSDKSKMKKVKDNYCYCSGINCALRESCKRWSPNPPDIELWWIPVAYMQETKQCPHLDPINNRVIHAVKRGSGCCWKCDDSE